jgi:hypothetical protein
MLQCGRHKAPGGWDADMLTQVPIPHLHNTLNAVEVRLCLGSQCSAVLQEALQAHTQQAPTLQFM